MTCLNSLNSFKSIFAAEPFLSGERYYFEVQFVKGCNFKIGVSSTTTATEVAFCDYPEGYGFYSAGQLRNGSKTSGAKYGRPYRGHNRDVIGVYVDLVDGKLFFSKNGEVFGVAF